MEVRGQNCEARLSVPSVGPIKQTRCPNCGVMMLIPPAVVAAQGDPRGHSEAKQQAALRRIFEPIPRPLAYAGGVLLILGLFAWLWLPAVMDLGQHRRVFMSDTSDLTTTTMNTNLSAANRRDLTLYGGVRLDARRDELERQFGLVLQNSRGMRPELYEGRKIGDVAFIVAGFYDGLLKEATLVMRERPVAMEVLQQELIEQFGEPQTTTDDNAGRTPSGLNGLRLAPSKDELAGKLASFPHRRALLWTDGNVRVDALIYSNEGVGGSTAAMLQIHLAATAWLQTSQTALRPVGLQP